MPVLLQKTQSLLDLLEEIKNQAPQGKQEMLSLASTFVETNKEVATLLIKIQTSAAAMANAPVGPIVVSLVIKLMHKADSIILKAGGSSPKVTVLISKMINRASRIIHNKH